PVVERMMPREAFIPNDVTLDEAGRVILLTGPNMAGKSTLLRQVGLCVVLAQMGAFVPARRAVVGVVDRLFTRVGASDNLALRRDARRPACGASCSGGEPRPAGAGVARSGTPRGRPAAPGTARRRAARPVRGRAAAAPAARRARGAGRRRAVAARSPEPPRR